MQLEGFMSRGWSQERGKESDETAIPFFVLHHNIIYYDAEQKNGMFLLFIKKILVDQGGSQDFSRGGSVCGKFANHTHFLKTTPIIHKLRGTAFNN